MDPFAPLRADPARSCLLCDCDGTLAPIVDDPAAAAPLPASVAALHRLSRRMGRVAVISGRPAAWLHDRFGDGLALSGLYGLEGIAADAAGAVVELAAAEPWRRVVAGVAQRAEAAAPAGVFVERKGLSVTFHYRRAPAERVWVERFAAEQASVSGLELLPGKAGVELRPPLPIDKGTAAAGLAEGFAVVAYVGDDSGDLPAFAALDVLASAGVVTVKVVVASAELPDDVRAAADVMVDGPEVVAELLSGLASSLR